MQKLKISAIAFVCLTIITSCGSQKTDQQNINTWTNASETQIENSGTIDASWATISTGETVTGYASGSTQLTDTSTRNNSWSALDDSKFPQANTPTGNTQETPSTGYTPTYPVNDTNTTVKTTTTVSTQKTTTKTPAMNYDQLKAKYEQELGTKLTKQQETDIKQDPNYVPAGQPISN